MTQKLYYTSLEEDKYYLNYLNMKMLIITVIGSYYFHFRKDDGQARHSCGPI